jgi:hypothetical protein
MAQALLLFLKDPVFRAKWEMFGYAKRFDR